MSIDDGMEIIGTVILSDYKTEQEMHDLLIKYGFVKMNQDQIQQSQKQWKEEEMEVERKKKEIYKLREAQYVHERERKEEMKRKMREFHLEDERKRIRAEMQMNDYITRRKETQPQPSFSSSNKNEEYMVLLQDRKKLNERARDAAKVKKHYHDTMNEAKRGNIVLDDEKRKQMEADLNEANLILDDKYHLENKLKQLKRDLYEENKRKLASAREDL